MAQFTEWCEGLEDALAEPFPPESHKTKRKGGTEITFVGVWEYVHRLNYLVGPQGWQTGEPSMREVGGKLLMALPVTILGVTKVNVGTEDEEKDDFGDAATNAWAQAFKRTCACFSLGHYLYDPKAREAARRARPAARPTSAAGAATPEQIQRIRALANEVADVLSADEADGVRTLLGGQVSAKKADAAIARLEARREERAAALAAAAGNGLDPDELFDRDEAQRGRRSRTAQEEGL